MAKTYENNPTLIAPTGTMASRVLSNGSLIITGENQAMISQLSYLQSQYVSKLSQLEGLKDLQRIQVRLRNKTIPVTTSSEPSKSIPGNTRNVT